MIKLPFVRFNTICLALLLFAASASAAQVGVITHHGIRNKGWVTLDSLVLPDSGKTLVLAITRIDEPTEAVSAAFTARHKGLFPNVCIALTVSDLKDNGRVETLWSTHEVISMIPGGKSQRAGRIRLADSGDDVTIMISQSDINQNNEITLSLYSAKLSKLQGRERPSINPSDWNQWRVSAEPFAKIDDSHWRFIGGFSDVSLFLDRQGIVVMLCPATHRFGEADSVLLCYRFSLATKKWAPAKIITWSDDPKE